MRKIFDDKDEENYFCNFIVERLNKYINKYAESNGIEPIIEISIQNITDAIHEYEGC